MSRIRHRSILSAAVVLAAGCVAEVSIAQTYPTKPVRFIIANSPGGSDDFHGRLMATKFTELFGQQFVVDNRAGGGGVIGQATVVNAAPDGYTILLAGRSITAARYLNASLPFDPLKALTPVGVFADNQQVLVVHPSLKANNVQEFIALARAQPGKVSFGSGGGGGLTYIAPLIFMHMTRTNLLYVPYKNVTQAYADNVSGQVDCSFMSIAPAITQVNAGRLRALGVSGAARSPALPNVPTIAEAGVPGYEAGSWLSILAPAATPRAIIGTLNSAIEKIIAEPEIRERLVKAGSEPVTSSPEAFAKRMADASEQFGRIAKTMGIKPQ